jgi:hypothetical protein
VATLRCGHACDIEDLWLTDGASVGCHYLMKTLIRDENDAVGGCTSRTQLTIP